MTVAGKIWGQTELLEANGALEFHRIEFKKGVRVLRTQTRIQMEWFLCRGRSDDGKGLAG